jgi:hypothetical protein
VQQILDDPVGNIDTSFVSGETFFTHELKEACKRLGVSYNKGTLNKCFTEKCCPYGKSCNGKILDRSFSKIEDILKIIPIDFSNI